MDMSVMINNNSKKNRKTKQELIEKIFHLRILTTPGFADIALKSFFLG